MLYSYYTSYLSQVFQTTEYASYNSLIPISFFRSLLVLCAHFHGSPGQLCANTSKLSVLDSTQLGLLGVRTADEPGPTSQHPDAELDQPGQVALREGNGEPAGVKTVKPSRVHQVQTITCVCITAVQVTIDQ